MRPLLLVAASLVLLGTGQTGTPSALAEPGAQLRPGPVVTVDERPRMPHPAEQNAVVTDRFGATTVAWRHVDALMVRHRARSGHWGRAHAIGCASPGTGRCSAPDLAVDKRGTVVAVWTRRTRRHDPGVVQTSWSPRHGAWHAPVTLSGGEFVNGSEPRVVMGWHGTTVVTFAVWHVRERAGYAFGFSDTAVLYKPARHPWARADRTLFPHAESVSIGVADHGAAVALVPARTGGTILARRHLPGGGWSDGVPIGRTDDLGSAQVAVAPGGRAVAAWTHARSPYGPSQIRARMMTAHGRWLPPRTLSDPAKPDWYNTGASFGYPLWGTAAWVVMDGRGHATVAWNSTFDAGAREFAQVVATRIPRHRWRRTVLSTTQVGNVLCLIANRRGDRVLLTTGEGGARRPGYPGLYAWLGTRDGPWGAPLRVATPRMPLERSQTVVAEAGLDPRAAVVVAYPDGRFVRAVQLRAQ